MKRRLFLALPAAVPGVAHAFRTEEASFEVLADLEASCAGPEAGHDAIRAMLERLAAGEAVSPGELRALSVCPFCQCRVGFAAVQAGPLSGPRAPR